MSTDAHGKLNEAIARGDDGIWNCWRWERSGQGARPAEVDLTSFPFDGRRLPKFLDFRNVDLRRTNLEGTRILEANFRWARLNGARMAGSNVDGGYFIETDMQDVVLDGASMRGSLLLRSNLSCGSLVETNLKYARMIDSDIRGANLRRCRVYGTSAWGLEVDGNTIQQDLRVFREPPTADARTTWDIADGATDSYELEVDELELAQITHAMLRNENIGRLLDLTERKMVLILGRFSVEQKPVLNSMREALRTRGWVPAMFDFLREGEPDVIKTVCTLANMSRFVIADLTDPRYVLHEIPAILARAPGLPILPVLRQGGEAPEDLLRACHEQLGAGGHGRLLPLVRYLDAAELVDLRLDGILKAGDEARGRLRSAFQGNPAFGAGAPG